MQHPPSITDLVRQMDAINPRKLYGYYCNRSGKGRFTRKLRCKDDIREKRKRQKLARRQNRGR